MDVKRTWDHQRKNWVGPQLILARSHQYRKIGQPASPISTGQQAEPPNSSANEFEASLTAQLKRFVLA